MVKKKISFFLAFLFLFCCLPFSAFAADASGSCPNCGGTLTRVGVDLAVSVGIEGKLHALQTTCSNCAYEKWELSFLGLTFDREYPNGNLQ